MKCIACGRALLRFAVSVPTSDGLLGWGPKCSRRVVIRRTRRQRVVRPAAARTYADPRQLVLPLMEVAP